MTTHAIPLLPIRRDMRQEIIFDGCSVGLLYEVSKANFHNSFYDTLKTISKRTDTRAWIRSRSNISQVNKDFEVDIDTESEGECPVTFMDAETEDKISDSIVVIFYLSSGNNGNILVRDHVKEIYENELEALDINLDKLKPLDIRPNKKSNFISAVIRQSDLWPKIRKTMQEDATSLLFKNLSAKRSEVDAELHQHIGSSIFDFKTFTLGAIELSLDLLTPIGVHWANEVEIALRLARLISFDRKGLYLRWSKKNAVIPTAMKSIIENRILQMQRLYDHEISAGIPVYYGHLSDGSSLYIATKEAPTVPCSWNLDSSLNRSWLTRLEWKINRDVRLSKPGNLVLKYGKRQTFTDEHGLSSILDNLYQSFFSSLSYSLNVPFYLEAELKHPRVRKIMDYYMPISSGEALARLGSHGRVTQHHSGLSLSEVDRAKKMGMLIKDDNHQSDELILESNFFRNKHFPESGNY